MISRKYAKTGGLADVIRCELPSYLIWKWHPEGAQQGSGKREFSIRWGSRLRVKDGEVAVFVYTQKDGTTQDFIVGPFDQTIKTANFPVLSSLLGVAYEGDTPFQAEIYFLNLAQIIQVKFGVPFFDVFDPRFLDFGVPVAVRGTLSFNVIDYQKFIKLHRLQNFSLDDFTEQVRDAVNRYVKDTVANAPTIHNIPVVQLQSRVGQINDLVESSVRDRLEEHFGVNISGVDIRSIEIDKTSDGYIQLVVVTKDLATATAQAQASANIKDIHDKQKIEVEHYEAMLKVQREEGQYAQHMQTRSNNFGAFQIEKQAEVGVAGANALGQMGANGGGSISITEGGSGTGFNPTAMMTGMAVGGAIGQNMANMMNNMLSGVNEQTKSTSVMPPPIPSTIFHIAIDGQAKGPFDLTSLKNMISVGQLTPDSLVWKSGMADWSKAGSIDELRHLFSSDPPALSLD